MPIRIIELNGKSAPVVICDVCNEQINHATKGNYEWVHGERDGAGSYIFFTHKECSEKFRQKYPKANDAHIHWCPLAAFPIYLGKNLELDWEEAMETATNFSDI
ncbi:MAG: hypothetical protein GDA67_15080 [Nitrospira sp. CR1.3]|nr:hypothetical protein [Nitrospira sp. CR1.3]